ncbi:MAG: HPr(Ser) kinase/phosphatase [Bacteroidota bacterium]|nr:HPr(Ser) kinase/phosphatase [Candidatus Kapabacteria bacterium]MCS7302604.1 HPr(Ser) kinase/phosphatase [Candidatus Kapabacteria bacterium]MCX7936462.1 HPr(Ser) kinase/phosphatase [Chlorobiota bacterium]MDW8074258.1 HPr(Ser) kinase/phosphatase [Bacteroidota bacterium]MDW8271266.1 HPr(Ser) kinase/phosphatase [Bacteroidota bacterium]
MNVFNVQPVRKQAIAVRTLLEAPLQLRSLNETVGWDNLITDESVHRPQLALAGFLELFTSHRLQVMGNTEVYYLRSLATADRLRAFRGIVERRVPAIVLTNSHTLDQELLDVATEYNVALLQTPYETTRTVHILSEFLGDQFAPHIVVHGSFVDVYGVGVLFVGRSGIGKSEIALDLVERGHRLVADDVVILTRKRDAILMGTGSSLIEHMVEVRGLGIIDVRQMFGIRAIRYQKRLEIVVELEDWNASENYERVGLDDTTVEILGIPIASVKLPIFPGKNITVIAEVIALNYLLRTYGYNAARHLAEKLEREIRTRSEQSSSTFDQRAVTYFQGDDE